MHTTHTVCTGVARTDNEINSYSRQAGLRLRVDWKQTLGFSHAQSRHCQYLRCCCVSRSHFVYVLYLLCIPRGGLVGRVWREFWLECVLIGQDSNLLLIGCLSPGFHFWGFFKSVQPPSFSLLFFLFSVSFLLSLHLCIWWSAAGCVFDVSMFDGLKQNQQRALLCVCQFSKAQSMRWLATATIGDKWSIMMSFLKTELRWFTLHSHIHSVIQSLASCEPLGLRPWC